MIFRIKSGKPHATQSVVSKLCGKSKFITITLSEAIPPAERIPLILSANPERVPSILKYHQLRLYNATLSLGITRCICVARLYEGIGTGPLFNLFTGGLMLGSIFMATDYVTSPMTNKGMIIFGVGIGVLTVLIRYFGSYPEGVSFAILIMNLTVPLLNKYCKPVRYGYGRRK